MEPEKVAKGVAALYSLMGSQDQGQLTDAVANEYFRATQDVPQWAIEEAIDRFRLGKEGDGRFVPKPPQLAAVARQISEIKADYLRDKAKREREQQEISHQISERARLKRFHESKTPESIARVGELLKRTKQKLAEVAVEDQGADLDALRNEEPRNTHNHFAGQARQELIKSLGQS